MRSKRWVFLGTVAAFAVVAIVWYSSLNANGPAAQNITVGSYAPDFGFRLGNGTPTDLSAFRGNTVLLWLVATWCSSCAQGNIAINQNYQFFKQKGVNVIEVELYKDLGYNGPSITNFVDEYAPSAYSNGTILPGVSGYNMTAAYDPNGYLDIYYLISGSGKVLYISGSPASTLGQLMQMINRSA